MGAWAGFIVTERGLAEGSMWTWQLCKSTKQVGGWESKGNAEPGDRGRVDVAPSPELSHKKEKESPIKPRHAHLKPTTRPRPRHPAASARAAASSSLSCAWALGGGGGARALSFELRAPCVFLYQQRTPSSLALFAPLTKTETILCCLACSGVCEEQPW